MKKVPVGKDQFALVDDDDYEEVIKYKWYIVRDGYNHYAQRRIVRLGKVTYLQMHRHILNLKKGDGKNVDHRNMDGLDNQKGNLRICTVAENNYNKPLTRQNRSGYKGVSWCANRDKWASQVAKNGKTYWLGRFNNAVLAAMAYDKKAKELFGEFARLNFPREGELSCLRT